MWHYRRVLARFQIVLQLLTDLAGIIPLAVRRQGALAADILMLRRQLTVFVVIEHRSRRLIHCNVTANPSAAWTLQQLREAIGFEERYQYLLHDRDSIFAKHLDESANRLGTDLALRC
jgi:hypothetical protein